MSEIIGILGLQGWGKTALTTYFGFVAFCNGRTIYSNYPVSYPHILIKSLKEAQECRNGYLLLDEFWRWVHARTSQSKINKEMMAICLLNRKRNVSIIYNTQLPRTIDVILRDVTNYRYLPQMKTHSDGKRYIHYVMRDLLDRESIEMMVNSPIDEIGKLYSTNFEVGDLETNTKKTFLEKGIDLEKDCISALKKLKIRCSLQPNSGINSGMKGDIILSHRKKNYQADVKRTTEKGYVLFCEKGKRIKNEMDKFYNDAKEWNRTPIILFPVVGKQGNFLKYPSNWLIYELTGNSYLFNTNNEKVRYNKLSNKSLNLKKWANLT